MLCFRSPTGRMFRYHVTFNSQKTIIDVDDKSKLTDVIGQTFNIDPSLMVIHLRCSKLNDWLDVDDVSQLPDKCHLHVFEKGESSTDLQRRNQAPKIGRVNYSETYIENCYNTSWINSERLAYKPHSVRKILLRNRYGRT